jgi:hypothetical protein
MKAVGGPGDPGELDGGAVNSRVVAIAIAVWSDLAVLTGPRIGENAPQVAFERGPDLEARRRGGFVCDAHEAIFAVAGGQKTIVRGTQGRESILFGD